MTGIICMWSGSLVDIPNGWALCDGENGTPDLRERFVRGAADTVNPGGTGGSLEHVHLVQGNTFNTGLAHTHKVVGNTGQATSGSVNYSAIGGAKALYQDHLHPVDIETDIHGDLHKHGLAFNSELSGSLPPYYDIAFIMKI